MMQISTTASAVTEKTVTAKNEGYRKPLLTCTANPILAASGICTNALKPCDKCLLRQDLQ